MKLSRNLIFTATASLFFAAGAFAKPANTNATNKGNLHLDEGVTVDGKQLPPGDYKVEWSGNGPQVDLNFVKGRETIMTAPARIVQENRPNDNDAYVAKTHDHGSKSLDEIMFSGKHYELDLNHGADSGN